MAMLGCSQHQGSSCLGFPKINSLVLGMLMPALAASPL